MDSNRNEKVRGLTVLDGHRRFRQLDRSLTLRVPARPEALGIVRLVLMSCGAAAGMELDKIFERSQEIADAFASVLVARPEATSVLINAQMGGGDVNVVPIRETRARRES